MTRLGILFAVIVALMVGGWAMLAGPARAAGVFHVDQARGSDTNDGGSPATAWKHAPGDPQASGRAGGVTLKPGDTVRFAAGRYRGAIVVRASGTAQAPIRFVGASAETSIIDGSDPIESRPCRNAGECGGAADWRKLSHLSSPAPFGAETALFADGVFMRPSQGPDPANAFYRDEIADMIEVDGAGMERGEVRLPPALARAAAGGRLALWVKPNLVVQRPVIAVAGDVARFDPSGLQFYTDRPARAAAVGTVGLIDRPGEYAVLPGGRGAVALLPPGSKGLSRADGRGGFRLKDGASHIVFEKLGFARMADAGDREGGAAILTDVVESRGITIEDCRFADMVMTRGQGPITLRRAGDVRIVGNHVDRIVDGSGIRLSGPAAGIVIENNEIRSIGRTAIMVMSLDDVLIRRNTITDVMGVHGNGISAYLANHDVRIVANTIRDAKQPATFHGDNGKSPRPNDILFANNLFVAMPDSLGALISWGKLTRGVTIRDNVLLGGKAGLRLSGDDRDIVITNNVASGLLFSKPPGPDVRMEGNTWTALSSQQRGSTDRATSLPETEALATSGATAVAASICARLGHDAAKRDDAPGAVGAALTCR